MNDYLIRLERLERTEHNCEFCEGTGYLRIESTHTGPRCPQCKGSGLKEVAHLVEENNALKSEVQHLRSQLDFCSKLP